MDPSPDSVTTDLAGIANERTASNQPSAQEENPAHALSPTPVTLVEAPESASPRSTTAIGPGESIEHAYWTEFEEDTTTPDEEELKEIDGADADYSARDREFNVDLQGSSLGLLMRCQTRIGRTTSSGTSMTPNMCLGRRPA